MILYFIVLLQNLSNKIRACAIAQAPNWDNFQTLTSSSSVTTRQYSNEFSMHSLLRQFLDGEVRYLSLKKVCPNEAQELFDAAKKAAQHRYATYVRMSKIDYSAE